MSFANKYLLPFHRLPFSFVDYFLCCAEAFYFDEVPVVYFCFVSLASRDVFSKKLLRARSKRFFERERDRVRVGYGQRGRETQNLTQTPGSELSAQSTMWGSNT